MNDPEENDEDVMGSAHTTDETAPMGSTHVDVPGALTQEDCDDNGDETDKR